MELFADMGTAERIALGLLSFIALAAPARWNTCNAGLSDGIIFTSVTAHLPFAFNVRTKLDQLPKAQA